MLGLAAAVATTVTLGLDGVPLAVSAFLFAETALLFVLGAARLGRVLRDNPTPRVDVVECHADERVLTIGDESIPREQVVSASVIRRENKVLVELGVRRGGILRSVRLWVDDVAAGERLLVTLGLGVSQRASTFAAGAPLAGRRGALVVLGLAATCFGMMMVAPPAAMPFVALALVLSMFAAVAPQTVRVGADGLRVSWLQRRRFIPFERIAEVREEVAFRERVLTLVLTTGEALQLPLGLASSHDHEHTLRSRIEAARRAHAAGEVTAAESLLARRPDDDPRTWLERLRVITEVGQHRRGAVLREQLFRILESPVSSPLARAAAAVALGPRSDGAERRRIGDVAQATASEGLRVALAAEVAGDDDALAEALAVLDMDRDEEAAGEAVLVLDAERRRA